MTRRFFRLGLIARGIGLMTAQERWQAVGIIMLMMAAGFFESLVVALIVPLVYVIVDPSRLANTAIGARLTALLGHPVETLFPWFAGALVMLLVISAAVTMLAVYCSEAHSARCRDRTATDLLRRISAAPYLWLLQQSVPVLVRHVHEDVRAWRKEFIHALLMMLQATIMIVSPAAVAIAIAPGAAFVALALVGAICVVVVLAFRKRIRHISSGVKVASDAMMRSLHQILQGIREVKVSGHADYFARLFGAHHAAVTGLGVSARLAAGAPASTINLLGQIGFVATALVLWRRGGSGADVVAQLALIGVVVSRVVPAANRLAAQIASLYRSAPFVESLCGLHATLDKIAPRIDGREGATRGFPAQWHSLELRDASFQYPGASRAGLNGVRLQLERGRFYGFVGRSGAGKTTLVNLLLGLLDPTEGQVLVDGVPLQDFAIGDWHRRVGYVPQDAFILDATLRDNITFGEPPSDERVLAALARARLSSLVDGLKAGLDTELGERGRRFSGGQAQRVAIARALYKGCDILLLDEATSALDSITEAEIHESLEPLRDHVLALMIAHRVSTLRRCDRIFVLDAGRIVAEGSYEQLMERSELFRALAAQDRDSRESVQHSTAAEHAR